MHKLCKLLRVHDHYWYRIHTDCIGVSSCLMLGSVTCIYITLSHDRSGPMEKQYSRKTLGMTNLHVDPPLQNHFANFLATCVKMIKKEMSECVILACNSKCTGKRVKVWVFCNYMYLSKRIEKNTFKSWSRLKWTYEPARWNFWDLCLIRPSGRSNDKRCKYGILG